MKTISEKFAVMTVAVAACLIACKKEQNTGQSLTPVYVSYKVTDRLQVNNEDGKPRPLSTLPVINDEAVALSTEALSHGQVDLKNTGQGDLVLNVLNNAGGKLTLTQNYPAAGGLASGTICYALSSN